MASDLTSEVDGFKAFVSEHLNGSDGLTLEESLERYRKFQHELASAREKLKEAEKQSARGESSPLEQDALKSDVRKRLASEGVMD